MTPRLLSSKMWTELPKAYTQAMVDIVKEVFQKEALMGEFIVQGRIYPEEVQLRMGYVEKGKLKQHNFEISMNCSQEKLDADDRMEDCFNVAAYFLEQYFENLQEEEPIEWPIEWSEQVVEGKKAFIKTTSVNTKLESLADEFLKQGSQTLVTELEDTDDALNHSELLNIDYSKLNSSYEDKH